MAIFNSYVRLPEGKLWDVLWMELFAEVTKVGSLCSANAIRTSAHLWARASTSHIMANQQAQQSYASIKQFSATNLITM